MLKKDAKGVKFVGGYLYVAGLPARDMSMEEWDTYPKERRDIGLKTGVYEYDEAPGGTGVPAKKGTDK